MPIWKLNIFIKAVNIRFNAGEGTVIDIVGSYTKLTEAEKQEIINVVNSKNEV